MGIVWDLMPFEPECATLEQRQAIGALCYDAGVSVKMHYSDGGSGALPERVSGALKNVFSYSNAIFEYINLVRKYLR